MNEMIQNPDFQDFFGVNLYDIPNQMWTMISSDYDEEDETRTEIYVNGSYVSDYFKKCSTMVNVDNDDMVVVFDSSTFLEDEVYKVLSQLRQILLDEMSCTPEDCEDMYSYIIDDPDEFINIQGKGIRCTMRFMEREYMSRLFVFVPFYKKEAECIPSDYVPEINLENFYGINLKESPNSEWTIFEAKAGKISFKYHDFVDDTDLFSGCGALINMNNRYTSFFFDTSLSHISEIIELLCKMERDLVYKGAYSMEKGREKFRMLTKNILEPININAEGISFGFIADKPGEVYFVVTIPNISLSAGDAKIEEPQKEPESTKYYPDSYQFSFLDAEGKRRTKFIKNGNFNVKIVGVQYRENHETFADMLVTGAKIQLKKDPENPYDRNAIAAYIGGYLVGYIIKRDIPIVEMCMHGGDLEVEIDYSQENEISVYVPVKNFDISKESEELYGPLFYTKIERTKSEGRYAEFHKSISKEIFIKEIKF